MAFDNAYEALTETSEDDRWAFGTGFHDEFSGLDRAVLPDVDAGDLARYCLMLGDDALVLAQRTCEWCARAPELEEDVALANIALDLLGQARLLLTRAAQVDASVRPAASPARWPDEDALAYFRDEHEFRNVRLVEVDNGDFAATIARLLVFSTWRLALFSRLRASRDPVLGAVAAKAVKELAYHRDHVAQWTLRLGDGTEFSRSRMRAAVDRAWPYVEELFTPHEVESRLAEVGVAVDPATLRAEVDAVLDQVLSAATLERPVTAVTSDVINSGAVDGGAVHGGGRDGVHTGALGHLLAEMQGLARSQPEAVW